MTRSETNKVIEKIKKKISTLLQRTEKWRVSILSSDASDKIEDVIFPTRIKS